MSRALLVTGATGKQGGAVIKALQLRDTEFRLLALTRDTSSRSARHLASKFPSVTLIQGNLNDTDSIFRNIKASTNFDIWGVFGVQTPYAKGGVSGEERQGKALVDSALKFGVKHFVYSSVDRHGDTSINNPTNVPHFASKHRIEHHLINACHGTSMRWTILRPVAFMENFDGGFLGKIFATGWKIAVKSRPLQLVAIDDVGVFAAKAFTEMDKYRDRSVSLAGDELSYGEMSQLFLSNTGSAVPTMWGFLARILLFISKDLGAMFRFFEAQGYGADIGQLRKEYPELTTLDKWLKR